MAMIEVRVPDIGNYRDVPVIELLVAPGDSVRADQGLVTLESDKATMEVPCPVAGRVVELLVKLGDAVSEGTVVARVEAADAVAASPAKPAAAAAPATPAPTPAAAPAPVASAAPAPAIAAAPATGRSADFDCDVAVLGSGPGGYTAAFRAADLEQRVVLIERYPTLGGVCLNVGCIPSKALLHTARVIDEAAHGAAMGLRFGAPEIDLPALRAYKDKVVGQLTQGLAGMAKQRKVTRVTGSGRFVSPHEIEVETADGKKLVRFRHAIIAAGSQPVKLPGLPWGDPRLMDSTDALMLAEIPKRLLVIGGGIIGLEMACVYDALGSRVTVVELQDQLMPGADPDLVRPLEQRLRKRYGAIRLKTKVARLEPTADGLVAHCEGPDGPLPPETFDRVLCAVGRTPNGGRIGAEAAGVAVDARGYIAVDRQLRTNVPHIFAIGDLVGQPMLAHKATHEGKVAAEVAAGLKREFVARVIPSVAYTDPEVAWVGLTETEARARGLHVGVGRFPHAASGRAIGIGRTEGFTKLLFDEATHRVLGAGIVGPNAGDLIAEAALAIEMGAVAADIGLTIHPHPTLAESVGMAAEAYEGTITDLYLPKKR
jgi:dihydrolipoamide dehydrogenase